MKLLNAVTVIAVCLLVTEARRSGGGGSRGGSRGSSSSGSRSRPGSSSSSRDRTDSKPYPVQPKPPSYPSAPSAPGHTWNTGSGSAPGWNLGSNSPPAPGWNLGGQPKSPGSNGLLNPPTNPHWNPSAGSGFPQNKPPAPGWNVGNNNPSPGFGTNTFQQHGSQPGWNTGGYGSRPAGGFGSYGNSYGGGYGHQQSLPTYGSPPTGWNNPVGNFNFGNRMGGFGGPGFGAGSLSKGSSKTGLLAAAGAGAATVAGVYFLSQAMSPSRGYGSGSGYYPGGGYHSGYPSSHNGPIGSSGSSSSGPNNQPPMPQMLCTGGTNNCTYTPIAVQCVNATFNGSDGQMQWQIACGDPKMSTDLCFSKVNLTCTNATVLSMDGNTSNVTTQVCKLEYAIDHVKDSNCTASLTFPEQYVSNSASKSGSSGRYWALLIIPIGIAIVGGICWMTGCGSNSSGGKNRSVQSHTDHFSPEVSAPLHQSNQPYPTSGMSYQSQAPPYASAPGAPYPDMPMPSYPTGPYPPANAPSYMQSNFSGYPTGVQPPYPTASY